MFYESGTRRVISASSFDIFFFLYYLPQSLIIFCLLAVLWLGCFVLLYAVISGGQTSGLQISHRASTEMVSAGRSFDRKEPFFLFVLFWFFFVLFIYLCIFFVLCFSCTGFELHLKTHKYIAK